MEGRAGANCVCSLGVKLLETFQYLLIPVFGLRSLPNEKTSNVFGPSSAQSFVHRVIVINKYAMQL